MASAGGPRRFSREPGLDGLRGIAILLVIVGHAGINYGLAPLAAAGVTLFFVLSGYLITTLLEREHQETGRIRLTRFYIRRATRLAPPLVAMLTFVALFAWPGWRAIVSVGTWSANYAVIAGVRLPGLGHAWSLSVEEQFYLIWPIALMAVPRRKMKGLATVLCAALLLWRGLLHLEGADVYAYYALETSGSALLGGAVLALRD